MSKYSFSKAKSYFKQTKNLCKIFYEELRVNMLGQIFPVIPDTLNLLVNDICNSKCQMCSIWNKKKNKEITPSELSTIINDSLFKNLKHVGVSGGEPTLRSDLPEIYRVLAQKKPPLLGTGIITNALQKNQVIKRISASAKICRDANLPFSIMVSLDGVGDTHDQVRGRKGNFQSAKAVLRYFRDETDIPISIGCTISKTNVWQVHEVLEFCQKEGIYGRFRVAEFIKRLYNYEQIDYIRNFSDLEKYHLCLFFAKLEYQYENSENIKRTYRNIRQMLGEDKERSIKCPYQATAVTLDSRCHLSYCSPQSETLGCCIEKSALKIYKEKIDRRRAIINWCCGNCIHDYHAGQTVGDFWLKLKDKYWRKKLSIDKSLKRPIKKPNLRKTNSNNRSSSPQVLIIGWYGTETAGDKAILAEIIYKIKNKYPRSRIVLSSLNPYISKKTLKEINHTEIDIIPVFSRTFWKKIKTSNQIIMGGGPLMHIEELGVVLSAFSRAKANGLRTRIMGCGVGPLNKDQKYVESVKQILMLSDEIELRDSASVSWARDLTARADIRNSQDYATGFVNRWKKRNQGSTQKPLLNLYLRDWSQEYRWNSTIEEFERIKKHFEVQLSKWVNRICNELDLCPKFLPMHHFCIGGDDREFNYRFATNYLTGLNPIIETRPLSVQELLTSMLEARLCLCMRFHSVLFANTLDVPFLAIDYTLGGKIYGYLQDQNRLDRLVSIKDISSGRWRKKIVSASSPS